MPRVTNPADPRRCQRAYAAGQCMNQAEPGSDYCHVHGGAVESARESRRLYHLAEVRHQQRLAQLTEHDQIQSLAEVIALARMLVEKRFNLISTDAELISALQPLNQLLLTVERIVKSAHTIEESLKELLSKSDAYRMGRRILEITAEELGELPEREMILEGISSDMVEAITAAGDPKAKQQLDQLAERVAPGRTGFFRIENEDDCQRLKELTSHNRLKSLQEDIALTTMLIERRWNIVQPHEELSLIGAIPQINTLLRTLEKQIVTAHSMEQSLGQLLTSADLRSLGDKISQILVDRLEGVSDREALVDRIIERLVGRDYQPADIPQLEDQSE